MAPFNLEEADSRMLLRISHASRHGTTEKGFRYLPVHEIATELGSDRPHALTNFPALTGCDTVSSLADHGKVEEDRSRLDCVPRSNMCTFEVFVATN